MRQRQRRFLQWLRSGLCRDCGQHASDRHFDHVVGPKLFNIGSGNEMTRPTWTQLAEEIMKCELVCPGCHVVRTMMRGVLWRPPLVSDEPPF